MLIGAVLSVLLVGLAILAWAWIDWQNTTYLVTSKAVYQKRGARSRRVHRVPIEKIQNTNLSQGILGTRHDYGSVEISTVGSEGAEIRLRGGPDPRSVQDRLNQQIRRMDTREQVAEIDSLDTGDVLASTVGGSSSDPAGGDR